MTPVRSNANVATRTVFGYAAGAVVDGIVTQVVNTFLLFYVTMACGLPAALAGLAASLGLVADAIADPTIGAWSDRLRSRWGRRLPFMVASIPVLCTSFVLLFSLPDWRDSTMLFALLVALSISVRVSLSFFNLPYLAVGAELSESFAERSRIMAWRWAAGMTGVLIAIGIGFGVFLKGTDGLAQRHAYPAFAQTLAALALVASVCAIVTIWRARHLQHPMMGVHPSMKRRFSHEVSELLRNPSFRILFVGSVMFFAAIGMTQSLGLHANKFFWQLTTSQIQQISMSLLLGALVGAPLSMPVVRRIEKRTAALIGLCGWILIQALPVTLRLAGWLALTGTALTFVLSAATFIAGMLMSMAAVAVNSMMADAADEHEYLFGVRREALFFAGWTLAIKAASGVGTLLSGILLTAIAFPVDDAKRNGLHLHVPDHTLHLLGLFYGPGAATVASFGVLLLVGYRLDRRRHADIVAELQNRRTPKPIELQHSV